MNAVEQALAREALDHWGHADWRDSGHTPTYFFTADKTVFARYVPNSHGLWVWHWFTTVHGRSHREVIRGVEHLRTLLHDLRNPPCSQ